MGMLQCGECSDRSENSLSMEQVHGVSNMDLERGRRGNTRVRSHPIPHGAVPTLRCWFKFLYEVAQNESRIWKFMVSEVYRPIFTEAYFIHTAVKYKVW